jgi:integrase
MNPVEPIRDLAKLTTIKRTLRKRSPRDYLLFTLGVNSALRVGDLLKLRVADVVDDAGQVREFLTLRENKTGKDRRVKLNEAVVEAIGFFVAETKPAAADVLFKSPRTGRALTRVQVWRLLNKWALEAGITDRIGAHTMRKSWGYQARKQGVPLELIQAKLGHSSPAVTRRYIGITADEIERVEDDVNL